MANNKLNVWSLVDQDANKSPSAAPTLAAPASASIHKVDPRLVDILQKASEDFPYEVRVTPSGGANSRKSRSSQHNRNKAIDIQIYDENGNAIPNYQNGSTFRLYEQFAQKAREVQQQQYPELDKNLRWGGYFSGNKKYGALDLMHFDLGGSDSLGMQGGSWQGGLNNQQRQYYPTAESVGLDNKSVSPAGGRIQLASASNIPGQTMSDADLENALLGGPIAPIDKSANRPEPEVNPNIPDWALPKRLRSNKSTDNGYSDADLEKLLIGENKPSQESEIQQISTDVGPKDQDQPTNKKRTEFLPGEIWNGVRVALQPAGLDPDPPWFKNSAQTDEDKEVGRERDSWGDWAGQVAVGAGRGARNVLDTAAEGLGAGASWAADKVLPESWAKVVRDSHNETVQLDKKDRETFERNYGNRLIPKIGEFAGELGATAPIIGASGVGAVGSKVGAMMPKALSRIGAGAATGALAGAEYNMLTSSKRDQPAWQQAMEGALGGAAFGGGLAAAGAAGKGIANKLIGRTDEATKKLAQRAEDLGINLRGAQVSSSPNLQKFDQISMQLPGSGGGKLAAKQQSEFNRAVSRTFGEETNSITPDVIERARDRLGKQFEDIAKNSPNIKIDEKMASGLRATMLEAKDHLTEQEFKVIGAKVNDILKMAKNGELTGAQYQSLVRKDTPLWRATKSPDPNIRHYASQIRNELDDALERHTSPELKSQLKETRKQWKAMKTVEPLADKGVGDVSPQLLMGRVMQSPGGKRGGGQLTELADIGKRFLKEPKDSGTPQGTMMMNLMTRPITAIGGYAAGLATNMPYITEVGGFAAGNRLLRTGVLNRKYFRDAVLGKPTPKRSNSTPNRLMSILGAKAFGD